MCVCVCGSSGGRESDPTQKHPAVLKAFGENASVCPSSLEEAGGQKMLRGRKLDAWEKGVAK